MDTFLAVASRREVREYGGRPIPGEVVRRILDAGRLSGSAGNQQPWRFVVVSAQAQAALADAVSEPGNLRDASLVVALVVGGKGPVLFDAGRCAQNMLLAAWNDGVGGVPNGLADREAANAVVGVSEDEAIAIVLSFGYPARPRDAESPQRGGMERAGEAEAARQTRRVVMNLAALASVSGSWVRAGSDLTDQRCPCSPVVYAMSKQPQPLTRLPATGPEHRTNFASRRSRFDGDCFHARFRVWPAACR